MEQLISKANKQYDRQMLDNLNARVMCRWEDLLKSLGVNEYHESNYRVTSCCNVHGSDNPSSLNIYIDGCNSFPGMWQCHTNHCHDTFGKNIIGYVRGTLSRQKLGWSGPSDKTVTFNHAVEYLLDFLKTDYASLQSSGQNSSQLFTRQVTGIFARPSIDNPQNITRESIRQSLEIPSQYYIKRGYSPTILNAYDVGGCTNPKKVMNNRVVVPLYDQNYNYIGCTGRSIFEKCEKCNQYHNPKQECGVRTSKWLHSKGFKGSEHLYNYWNAKEYIRKSQIMIIVEGVGDTWSLEEAGIHNSVAIFGTAISAGQTQLIHASGAMSLIALLDNDTAGQTGMHKIQEQFGRLYRLYYPTLNANDVGDLTKDEVTRDILPYLEKIQKEII